MKKVLYSFVGMILAVIMAFTLCACGKNKTKNNSEFVGMQNIQSMVDYAEKLEKAGNTEAAARIWARIANAAKEAGGADAEKIMDDSVGERALDAIEKANRIIPVIRGGKGK